MLALPHAGRLPREPAGRVAGAGRLPTGVPAFLGLAGACRTGRRAPTALRHWPDFARRLSAAPGATGYLAAAVRGFFENGGSPCYVVRAGPTLPDPRTLLAAGPRGRGRDRTFDLVCAPDLAAARQPGEAPSAARAGSAHSQQGVLADCDPQGAGSRSWTSLPTDAGLDSVLRQRAGLAGDQRRALLPLGAGAAGRGSDGASCRRAGTSPASIARTDRARRRAQGAGERGARRACSTSSRRRRRRRPGPLNPAGVNCLRAFPGRGHPGLGRAHPERAIPPGATSTCGGCS